MMPEPWKDAGMTRSAWRLKNRGAINSVIGLLHRCRDMTAAELVEFMKANAHEGMAGAMSEALRDSAAHHRTRGNEPEAERLEAAAALAEGEGENI